MSKSNPSPAEPEKSNTPNAIPGATGVFGVLPPEPPSVVGPTPAVAAGPAADPPVRHLPEMFPRPPSAPVVVHKVEFSAEDTEGSEPENSLQRLMHSLPAPSTPAVSPVAAGEFTQLLSSLHLPPAGVVTPPPGMAGADVQPPVAGQAATWPAGEDAFPPANSISHINGSSAEASAESSFTRLFEALAPAKVPESLPTFQPQPLPAAQSGLDAPNQQAAFAAPRQAMPYTARGPAEVPMPQKSPAHEDMGASFTQLFAALDREPRTEPNQAADYPPLSSGRQAVGPEPTFQAGRNGGSWQPSSFATTPSGASGQNQDDPGSLTQLLRQLEDLPPGGRPYEAVVPSREAAQSPPGSGATMAFTPPESIQRLTAKPPAMPAGPGDFTRVLQASALRESGLGSQAAASAHPPEVVSASVPPNPTAAPPLPPWATPRMPPLPHLPPVPQVNSMGAGMGPVPGMHPHMPPVFSVAPAPLAREPQGTVNSGRLRSPMLPMILMAIIVILVGVLTAVLLRR